MKNKKNLSNFNPVFVLGAGFTKSFDNNAPLARCNIDLDSLLKKYHNYSKVSEILTDARIPGSENVNIESLLTRLSGMPYDESDSLWEAERKTVYENTLYQFYQLLMTINLPKDDEGELLRKFAQFIICYKASCVTFNYDDLMEWSLLNAIKAEDMQTIPSLTNRPGQLRGWNPMRGYGFKLEPAKNLIGDFIVPFQECDSLLLKLHGSMNWFVKKGYEPPYRLDALVFDESSFRVATTEDKEILYHIESVPFIIPPILDKSILYKYPILRVIWLRAFEKLSTASEVVFMGYSLPETDIVSRYLLRESLRAIPSENITVVTSNKSQSDKDFFIKRYEEALCKKGIRFEFSDVKDWIRENYIL